MSDLVEMGLYELVMNHPPIPVEATLSQVSSDHARRTYRKVITHYLGWIERDPIVTDPVLIANYKGELMEYMPPARVALWLRILRHLYQQACAEGLFKTNPAAAITQPAYSPQTIEQVPTVEEAQARLPNCRRDTEAGRRDHALYLLVISTGLPADTVRALCVADLKRQGEEHYLEIPSEAGVGPQRIALSVEVGQALDKYLTTCEVADDSPLFQPPYPKPIPPPIRHRWPTCAGRTAPL